MVMKTIEKKVILSKDGTPLSVMERPEGVGTFAEYHRKVESYREQYGHLLSRQTFEDFLQERKDEAARECDE